MPESEAPPDDPTSWGADLAMTLSSRRRLHFANASRKVEVSLAQKIMRAPTTFSRITFSLMLPQMHGRKHHCVRARPLNHLFYFLLQREGDAR